MKLIPYDIEKINARKYVKTKNLALIEEFVNSGADCMKIEDYPHKSAPVAQTVISASINRFGFRNVKVIRRGSDVFLIRVTENR